MQRERRQARIIERDRRRSFSSITSSSAIEAASSGCDEDQRGGCYIEMLHYAAHLFRRIKRRLFRILLDARRRCGLLPTPESRFSSKLVDFCSCLCRLQSSDVDAQRVVTRRSRLESLSPGKRTASRLAASDLAISKRGAGRRCRAVDQRCCAAADRRANETSPCDAIIVVDDSGAWEQRNELQLAPTASSENSDIDATASPCRGHRRRRCVSDTGERAGTHTY